MAMSRKKAFGLIFMISAQISTNIIDEFIKPFLALC